MFTGSSFVRLRPLCLAGWAVHMTLAQSRPGRAFQADGPATRRTLGAFEVAWCSVAMDSMAKSISSMENLPPGVQAAGLKIAKGKTYGHLPPDSG